VLIPKPGIPYENGGPVALWVNGVVITAIDKIGPFPKVEVVKTIVVWTNDGWLGGETPPVVTTVEGI
jgi:hypothetical protein